MAAPKKRLFLKNKLEKKPDKDKSPKDLKAQPAGDIGVAETKNKEALELDDSEVRTLYHWTSPSHIFVPRGKKWLTYVFLMAAIIILILLFVREFYIIAPVIAVAFVAYVLASIPPQEVEHSITSQGIITNKKAYLWEELYDFWFIEKHGHTVLNIEIRSEFPNRLIMLIAENEKDKVKSVLLKALPYRAIPKTSWIDSLGDSLSNIFHKLAS